MHDKEIDERAQSIRIWRRSSLPAFLFNGRSGKYTNSPREKGENRQDTHAYFSEELSMQLSKYPSQNLQLITLATLSITIIQLWPTSYNMTFICLKRALRNALGALLRLNHSLQGLHLDNLFQLIKLQTVNAHLSSSHTGKVPRWRWT